jgi:hypothetical protein
VPRLSDNPKTPAATEQSAHNAKRDELFLLINSLNPIITVETTEEERLEGLLRSIAVQLVVPFYRWSVTTGLSKLTGAPLYGTDQPEQALTNIALIEDTSRAIVTTIASAAASAISQTNSAPRDAPSSSPPPPSNCRPS